MRISTLATQTYPLGSLESKPVWRRYKHDRFCMPRVCVFTLSPVSVLVIHLDLVFAHCEPLRGRPLLRLLCLADHSRVFLRQGWSEFSPLSLAMAYRRIL